MNISRDLRDILSLQTSLSNGFEGEMNVKTG